MEDKNYIDVKGEMSNEDLAGMFYDSMVTFFETNANDFKGKVSEEMTNFIIRTYRSGFGAALISLGFPVTSVMKVDMIAKDLFEGDGQITSPYL